MQIRKYVDTDISAGPKLADVSTPSKNCRTKERWYKRERQKNPRTNECKTIGRETKERRSKGRTSKDHRTEERRIIV